MAEVGFKIKLAIFLSNPKESVEEESTMSGMFAAGGVERELHGCQGGAILNFSRLLDIKPVFPPSFTRIC